MEQAARLIVGLGFIAIFINLMKGGPDQLLAWYRAKFLGKVATA